MHLCDVGLRVVCRTFAYFQGKMGLLMRQCDTFGALDDEYALFSKVTQLSRVLFALPHVRLWLVEPTSNAAIIVFLDSGANAQNGRFIHTVGSTPADVVRGRKVLALHDAFQDSRYKLVRRYGFWRHA